MDCKVTFLPSGESITINDSATIMDAERALELSFEYPCGGNGTCGKCLVDIECDGRKYRAKACTTKVSDGMVVTLPDDVGVHNERVMTSGCPTTSCEMTSPLADYSNMSNSPLGIAFDIGTTTIAAYLLDLCSGEIIDTLGELNEQVKYGGDVISRCIYSLENGVDEIS
ncbi:MAG: 2Fe-2S iron-sulfur cluster-binding protein, partial [Clostridia bacterium]|nr:2Fe-2S iron-sulfur cluster-binding protein [Clostridia bacterium]